jgi:hypothetical protein
MWLVEELGVDAFRDAVAARMDRQTQMGGAQLRREVRLPPKRQTDPWRRRCPSRDAVTAWVGGARMG